MRNFKVLEIVGEGKTDVGKTKAPESPTTGIIPILVHTLCEKPADMRVKRRAIAFLQGKGWWQKVRFAKRQASYNGSKGLVFVLDTEGDHAARTKELIKGRDFELPDFPTAVGAAHACIEAWLLADAQAIAKAIGLPIAPPVPDKPENLPAPQNDRKNNAKTALAACVGAPKAEVSAAEKDRIALAIRDMKLVRERCPLSFAPFADEVEQRIRPVFGASFRSPPELPFRQTP